MVCFIREHLRWENPGIDVYSVPGICQPARNSPVIDFSWNRSLGAPGALNDSFSNMG